MGWYKYLRGLTPWRAPCKGIKVKKKKKNFKYFSKRIMLSLAQFLSRKIFRGNLNEAISLAEIRFPWKIFLKRKVTIRLTKYCKTFSILLQTSMQGRGPTC